MISTEQVWVKKDPDMEPCSGCKVSIVSAKYVLTVITKMGFRSETIETNTQLCQSCYDALKPEQK